MMPVQLQCANRVHVLQAAQLLQKCMSSLLSPLRTLAEGCQSAESFPAKGTTAHFAVTEMLHRVAVLFQNLGKCPSIAADALPEVWPLVQRYVELAAAHEAVVESAAKIIMCVSVWCRGVLACSASPKPARKPTARQQGATKT